METKKIGYVAVDSGQLIITDPCYLKDFKSNDFEETKADAIPIKDYSYNGACQATLSADKCGQLSDGKFKEAGVAVSTGYGDGCYPVFATYNSEGRVTKVEVLFVEEE